MICDGNSDDHCCWIQGKVCPHLRENVVEGRRWACGLLVELGSWDKVHSDERYLRDVQPMWTKRGSGDCGSYPGVGNICGSCGKGG